MIKMLMAEIKNDSVLLVENNAVLRIYNDGSEIRGFLPSFIDKSSIGQCCYDRMFRAFIAHDYKTVSHTEMSKLIA